MATATQDWVGRRTILSGWLRAAGERFREWRQIRLDHRLVPAEAQFFDAYCRGGARQREVLTLDYGFFARPGVQRQLRHAAEGGSYDVGEMESQFADAEPEATSEPSERTSATWLSASTSERDPPVEQRMGLSSCA